MVPPYRIQQFMLGVAERLRDATLAGASEASVIEAIATERTALAAAINRPEFREALAVSYQSHLQQIVPAAALSLEASRAQTNEVITHRMQDAQLLVQLVRDPAFMGQARALSQSPVQRPAGMPPEKIAEMVARFTANVPHYGVDVAIHRRQAMDGHKIGHMALAEAFSPQGALQPVLEQALAETWPQASAPDRQRLAADWLHARQKAAQQVVEALQEDGAVYQPVMAHNLTPTAPSSPFLLGTSSLTSADREARKTTQQKAEDVMYILNHTITCLSITDLLVMPTVNGILGTMLGDKAPKLGCAGHDHSHSHDDHGYSHSHADHGHSHHDHDHSPWDELKAPFRNVKKFFTSDVPWGKKIGSIFKNSGHWLVSEAAGDVGAVVPTIAMQRLAPGLMDSMGHGLENVFGGSFKRGAEKAAVGWGKKHGYDADSQEVVDRAQELYSYEVRHLPQMAVWTASSIGISYGVMRYLSPAITLGEFARTKIVGAAVTAGLVVGARALSPNNAHGWDRGIGKHVIVPATKVLGAPFGINSKDVDDFNAKRAGDDAPQWQGRVQEITPAIAVSA